MFHVPWTSSRAIATALIAAVAACAGAGAQALGATSFGVEVTPATGGTQAAPLPVTIGVRAAFAGNRPGALAPALRRLAISMPDGFVTALAGMSSCAHAELEARGSGACPPSSKLGSGGASFVYVVGALRIAASTQELSLYRGQGDAILLHLRITKPTTLSIVPAGTLTARPAPAGPLVTLDLSPIARAEGGASVVVTRAGFDLTRGFAAGPCPAERWTFAAHLDYLDGGVEERSADAPCWDAPDTAAPVLRASARDGTPALGARLEVGLSEAASVRIALQRRARGRWVSVRRATFAARVGSSVLRIRRANGRPLPHGRYRALLRALDRAGLASRTRTVSFRLY